MRFLLIDAAIAAHIHALDQTRQDGGLGSTCDGADYLCRDVRDDPAYRDYWPLLATASIYCPPISPRQARLAMLQAGLLDAVEAYITTQPKAAQVEWEYANEIRRDHALLSGAATALGLTEAQIDDLFSLAATL